MGKDQLVFDTTDATSIAHSDHIGAHVLAGDGTLIDSANINSVDRLAVDSTLKDGAGTALTSTLVGGKQALDVNIAEGVNVEVDLSHVDDSVRLGDGTDFFTSTSENGDVALDVHISNSSIVVTATDLDIRDLSHTQDSIQIGDGTDLMAVNADGSINAVVTATQLDIDDLDAATDSVASHLYDGAGTALTSTLVGADQALDVNVVAIADAALANTAIATAAVTAVADTATDVVSSPLANRKYLFVRNMDNKRIYIGASGVSVATGFPLSPQSVMELRVGASVDVEYIGSSGATPEIRTLELS